MAHYFSLNFLSTFSDRMKFMFGAYTLIETQKYETGY